MVTKTALVLDDRKENLDETKTELERKGYEVITAINLNEAKEKVLSAIKAGKVFDLIVSDYDLGRKIYQKRRMFDGYRFVLWCRQQGIKSEIILHSTAFEASRKIMRAIQQPIILSAQRKGITVQGKSVLLPSQRGKFQRRK